jgi:hypothetical protein
MLTVAQDQDGNWYHWQMGYNNDTEEYEGGEWVLDEADNKIPDHICLCFAYEPGECCCGCTSWDNYRYDDWE